MKPAEISPVTGLLSAKNRQTSTGNPKISKNEIRLRKNDAQTRFIEVPIILFFNLINRHLAHDAAPSCGDGVTEPIKP